MDHLVLIDGHHLMYRAYWAIPRTLKTKNGLQTNTVFGFASMLINILSHEEPDAILICFDEGKETFRHQEHDEYKAGRAETPDDFYEQIPLVIECISAFSLPYLSDPAYEADDLIGSYATQAAKQNFQVTIVSGDRDLLQLANEKTRIAIPHKGYREMEYLRAKEVFDKFGIYPCQVADFKGLCGDSSDNLPGVKGIGPKTAALLLQKYENIENIYKNLDEISEPVKKKLETDKEKAFFSKKMARLVTDIEIPLPLELLILGCLPAGNIFDFLYKYEFIMLQKRLSNMLKTPYGQAHFTLPADSFKKSQETSQQLHLFD